ncbi:MAG: AAA family ATPase [Candidatus Altiarchaeales archaeon]|nr:AAA family ATPase [Candidatus Altiarchaeales archaeon]MBD3416848.1 AAA family ATPase [Candidatus Altiarchaeales archaeon]
MHARKSTGIPDVDEMIEGGFREGSINMVDGDAGTGKSTFAVQFMMAGLAAGESAIYMSVEESKESFYTNMLRFGFNLEEYEKAGTLFFYEANAAQLKEFLDKGGIGIEDRIMQMKPQRFVLDSISAFALLYETGMKQRTAVQRFIEKLKAWNLTTLLISEATQDYTRFGLEFLVDGVVKLWYRKVGHERVRTIEIMKMRGTKHKIAETVYRIEENGIVLYPSETIF